MTRESEQTHEWTERLGLAEALDRRHLEIERRWLIEVKKRSNGRAVSLTELRDGMPDYLVALASALRREGPLEFGGTAAWAEIAQEHAVTRVKLGFDIDELIREFIILRRILFDIAREEGVIAAERQTDHLIDLVEAAVVTSVKSYVESRDFAARQREGEHIAFITHELRNPLTSFTLAIDQLRRTGLPMTPAQQRALAIAGRSADRMGELIDSVLFVERLESGKVPVDAVDVPLGDVLDEEVGTATAASQAKHLGLHADFDPEILVHVDVKLTKSALQNVLGNAVKYTPEGRIEVSAEEQPDSVVIHVRDNCEGLAAEEIRNIFEPFHRGSSPLPGTGVGLAIARRALEAQGGTIDAESGGERGCHFWLKLPKPPH